MLRRNLIVVFKPIKSTSVILSELNHRLMNLGDNTNSCLNITNNYVDHYCSWLPYGGHTIRDTEIGINASVAEALGLFEGTIVSCKVVDELPTLDTVYVTAANQKDWEMLEASSYRIQNTILDQTRIVNEGQKLIVWINKSIHITIKIDELSPSAKYGKIENNTELIVTPYKDATTTSISNGTSRASNATDHKTNGTERGSSDTKLVSNGTDRAANDSTRTQNPSVSNGIKTPPKSQPLSNGSAESAEKRGTLYDRLFNKNAKSTECMKKAEPPTRSISNDANVIDSTTLDNVTVKSTSDDDSSDSDVSYYDGNAQSFSSSSKPKLPSKKSTSARKNAKSSAAPKAKPVRLDVQSRLFDALFSELKNQDRKSYRFRAVPCKWTDSQMSDLLLTPHNRPAAFDTDHVYVLNCETLNEHDERITKEYYVNVRICDERETIPRNIFPSIEITDALMAHLKMQKYSRVTLSTKKTVLNFVEKIELIPATSCTLNHRDIEDAFKRLLIKCSRTLPMLINQEQVFRLDDENIVIAKIYPESFRYCLCDAEILRENKIFIVEQRRDLSGFMSSAEEFGSTESKVENADAGGSFSANECVIQLDEFDGIVEKCVENIVVNSCLDERNCVRKVNNHLIIGGSTTGKSMICKQILQQLEKAPYNCHVEVFHCAQNKARKTESIQKDLRSILSRCVERAPAILLFDNLDALAKSVAEHTHDGDYFNRVSDVIQQLITSYTRENAISIIATISSKNNLNQRLYTSRGNHFFQHTYKVPDLSKDDRRKVIEELCNDAQVQCDKINYEKFALLTEGYTIGYLLQFVERAVFYAHRKDHENPTMTNAELINSLKTTNAYCLQGIENNIKMDDCDEDESSENDKNPFAGLESVVTVFDEVLIWPSKYPQIFEQSPLRNQAGILLYGSPGTGKTYLVSQLSRIWNLRMISVKGPELLAKFIGQSEENVRNLFDKARAAKPCVLFFDEFDSIAPRRGHDSTGVTDRVVNQLLTELDGVEELRGVIVVAATSRPDLLDPALLRSGRIDRLVQCALPTAESRLQIFNSIAKSSSLKLKPNVNFDFFCDGKSENYTGADIKSILVSANMNAVKECLANDPNEVPEEIYISQKHVADAFNSTRPSLSYQDAIKYRNIYARFMKKDDTNRNFVAQRATLA